MIFLQDDHDPINDLETVIAMHYDKYYATI